MEIDLRRVDTAIINLAWQGERRAEMAALCNRLGLSHRLVSGIDCTPGRTGCGLSHIRAVRSGVEEHPLLILEDDLAETAAFQHVITVPDDADALYLGTSRSGWIADLGWRATVDAIAAEPVFDGLLRLHNMLGAHAILYLTARYRNAAIEAMIDAIAVRDWAPDVGLAMIQSDFNVYALAKPAFFQSALRGGQEAMTKVPVTVHPINSVLTLFMDDGPQNWRLVRSAHRLEWRPNDIC